MQRTMLGVMSGTSLDGVDLCLAHFDGTSYEILQAYTLPYSPEWKQKLQSAPTLSGLELTALDAQYGQFLGTICRDFLAKQSVKVDAIASHGHTIFHQPEQHFTYQLGNGAYIAAESLNDCIYDFRKLDVALHGQGAPLVPIGDELLFPDYTYCLNIGGFSNLSTHTNASRIAFDICPVNIVLNALASQFPRGYDEDGAHARAGSIHSVCLTQLNELPFYNLKGAKSLGREWVETTIFPILTSFKLSTDDLLATYTEHAAQQIGKQLSITGSCLTTGGGAWNSYLIERIQHYAKTQLVLPDASIVDFKEALIFAYLGYLFLENQTNTLRSVTGSFSDSIGGVLCKSPRTSCS